jgi:hypothetical protein
LSHTTFPPSPTGWIKESGAVAGHRATNKYCDKEKWRCRVMVVVYGFSVVFFAFVIARAVISVSKDLEEQNRRINEDLKKNRPWW